MAMPMDSSEIGSLIFQAAFGGNLAKLKETKERCGDEREFRRICDVHSVFCTGQTVLHIAAELGHFEICKFLIQKVKACVDVFTYREDTPLILAAKEERLEIVKYLIKQGAEVGMANSKGFTSLHYAVLKNNRQLMELLVSNGAPIEADSVDGTPLQCAASIGSVEAVKFLLSHDAEPNSISSAVSGSPLICAIKSHSFECMELLLEAKADIEKFLYGLTPLAYAAKESDTRFLESLLKARAKPDKLSTGFLKPIEVAALARNREGVRVLFPVTQKIPLYPNWTVKGIMEDCHSVEAIEMREVIRKRHLDVIDEVAKRAVSRKDYPSAIKLYSEAIYLDPSEPKWVSNRSLCYAHVGRRVHALRDAEKCVRLAPEWPKAHYRVGCAWKLFKNYHMAALAFGEASKLVPEDEELLRVYRAALMEYWSWSCVRFPKEMSTFQQFL